MLLRRERILFRNTAHSFLHRYVTAQVAHSWQTKEVRSMYIGGGLLVLILIIVLLIILL